MKTKLKPLTKSDIFNLQERGIKVSILPPRYAFGYGFDSVGVISPLQRTGISAVPKNLKGM
jgi:hypothetical protein